MTAGIIPAVFLTVSCQSVDDWFDRNKPEPDKSLTGSVQNDVTTYTPEEAAAFFCNRLIMKFSMYYSGKPFLSVDKNDTMSKKIAVQLARANVIAAWQTGIQERCFLKTKSYNDKAWHLVATDPKNGQVLLSLTLPLKKN